MPPARGKKPSNTLVNFSRSNSQNISNDAPRPKSAPSLQSTLAQSFSLDNFILPSQAVIMGFSDLVADAGLTSKNLAHNHIMSMTDAL